MILGGLPTYIIMVAIGLTILLSIYMPWKKGVPATYVLSASIIIILIAGFVMTAGFMEGLFGGSLYMLPSYLWRDLGFDPGDVIGDYSVYRFVTSLFIHADFLHAVSNLIGLLFIGYQFEQKVGWKRFLIFFYGTGILASCVILAISPFDILGQDMRTVGIGASAAIYGLLGAFFYLYPTAEIYFPLIIIRKWSISLVIFVYMALTTLFLFTGTNDHVSHVAHFAGLGVSFPLAMMVGRPPEEGARAKRPLDLSTLTVLARDGPSRRSLGMAKEADEPELQGAWLSDFFRKVKCPKCKGKGMVYEDERAFCPRCEHRIQL
jgi:membrane associated rhomboid family serine protease